MNKSKDAFHCHFTAGMIWSNAIAPSDVYGRLEALVDRVTDRCESPSSAVPMHIGGMAEGAKVGLYWQFGAGMSLGIVLECDGRGHWNPTAGGLGMEPGSFFDMSPPHKGHSSVVATALCVDVEYGPRQLVESMAAMFPGISQSQARESMFAGFDSPPFVHGAGRPRESRRPVNAHLDDSTDDDN